MWKQVTVSLIALSPYILDGINEGFSSTLLSEEASSSLSFKISASDISWIASISILCTLIGSSFSGFLTCFFGRKKVLLLLSLLVVLGWIFILRAKSVLVICIGRALNGFAIGLELSTVLYIAEITESPKYRAVLLSATNPAFGLGTTLSFVLGTVLSPKDYAMIVCCLGITSLAFTSYIPESPAWLKSNNDPDGATKASNWLRGKDGEEKDVEKGVKKNEEKPAAKEPVGKELTAEENLDNMSSMTRLIKTKAWKPYLHLTAFFILQQLAGYSVLVYYASTVCDLLNTPISSSLAAVILSVLQFTTWTLQTCLFEKLGRKTWTFISSVGVFVSFLTIALYESGCLWDPTQESLQWLPTICMWTGVVFSSMGISSLPWIMIGELFPASVSDFMGSAQRVTTFFIQFAVIKSFPLVAPYLGVYGMFMIFSTSGFVTIFYSLFLMPETRGKSLVEIEKYWVS